METPVRKKVLFVITKSNWGGAQRYVYDLATAVPQEHFQVAVALGGTGLLRSKLEEAGITVLPLESVQRDLSLRADLGGFSTISRAIRNYAPDIVHLNSSKAGGLGALAARMQGVHRIIFTAHGWPFTEQRNSFWRLFAFVGSWATALLSHTVIVVSENDLRLGRRLPFCSAKLRLIYNGIKLPLSLGSGERIRSAFPAGTKIVGTIGELTPNKNQMALIEAARHRPDLCIAIVGEGEERPTLEAKIRAYGLQNRVKLFGFIPAAEALAGFDTFTLPSLKEGLPYVLLEAKAAGLPITANRVGGIGEILDAKDMSTFSFERMLEQTVALYGA